jgi:uncharacterized membrane protein YqaE (UPF0057 family)
MSENELEKKIDDMEWTLFDRFMYGGLGHGYFCFPTNLVRIIFTVLFPPLGVILKHLKVVEEFPYITMQTLQNLFDNIGDIVYCFVLTSLFYVPGLIYGLSGLKCAETSGGDGGTSGEDFRDLTMDDIKSHFKAIKRKNEVRANLTKGV